MSFDGKVYPPGLDELTIMAALGNYPMETTMVHYQTRMPVHYQDPQRDFKRQLVGYHLDDHRMCIKCLGECSTTKVLDADGRARILENVANGVYNIVAFYPMTELNPCKRCSILNQGSPSSITPTGTTRTRTHKF